MSEEYSNGYARGYEAGQQSVLKLAEQPAPVQQELVLQPAGLSDAVYAVLEGFTLPHDVRKILETAFYGPAYTLQPARQPLTDEQIKALDCVVLNCCDWDTYEVFQPSVLEFARAIEAAHGIKQ